MKIIPQDDLILVEFRDRKNVTPQGIHIPENARAGRDLVYAEVLGVGQGAPSATGERTPHSVKKGDLILMASGSPCFAIEYGNVFHSQSKKMPKQGLVSREAVLAVVELEDGESLTNPVEVPEPQLVEA